MQWQSRVSAWEFEGTNFSSYDTSGPVGNRTQMTSTLNAVPPGSFSYDATTS